MCGVVAVIGKENASKLVIEGLKKLEYRGYDSAGIASVSDETLHIIKSEGKLVNLIKESEYHFKNITAAVHCAYPRSEQWGKKYEALDKFQDERLRYFGQKLIYREKPDLLTKELYDTIHKDVASKLLSKNSEKWNTIPKVYTEIDTLRVKFEKQGNKDNLLFLEDINAYVEQLEKFYSSV